jgi:uncharacterized protein
MCNRFVFQTVLLLIGTLSIGGCAGYAGAVAEVRTSLLAGNKERALKEVNRAMKVKDDDAYPKKIKGDNALLVLERAMVKQGLENWKTSSDDFRVSDKHLELLDLKNDTMGNIGKFMFSDDSTVYKAPAYEKLLLNTFNLLNYLAEYNIEDARVEARRLRVMQDYLADEESEQAALLGMGSYLAGFVFEMSGDAEQALTYYDEALANESYSSLQDPIRRLCACTGFRTERLTEVLGETTDETNECQQRSKEKGTVLVVSSVGLAPHKVARRIPIGAALVIGQALLTPMQTSQAKRFAARGLLTWINFPTMEKTPERLSHVTVKVDGNPSVSELGLDISEKVIMAWDSIKGVMMAAAVTRMITRLVAGVATEKAVEAAGGSGIGSLLAGLAVQGTLTAADTPDTRSWVTLPTRVYFTRLELSAGKHDISIVFEGSGSRMVVTKSINVAPGGYTVIPVASMR